MMTGFQTEGCTWAHGGLRNEGLIEIGKLHQASFDTEISFITLIFTHCIYSTDYYMEDLDTVLYKQKLNVKSSFYLTVQQSK